MRPRTDAECHSLPHVTTTGDANWDPRALDLDLDVDGDDDWCDAIPDDVDHSALFDAFGDHKGRMPDLEVSAVNVWFDAVAPAQDTRIQMEEATFFCSEHAFQVRHFDEDNFAAVLLVNNAEVVDAAPDKTPVVGDVPPDDQALCDEWHEALSGLAGDAPADDVQVHAFTVQDPDYEKSRPLFGWMNAKTVKKTFENTAQHARIIGTPGQACRILSGLAGLT
jgi:hypothetical protein